MRVEIFDDDGNPVETTVEQLSEMLGVPKATDYSVVYEQLFTVPIDGTDQDANDEFTVYRFETPRDQEFFKVEDSGALVAAVGITCQASFRLQVSDATANDRAAFYGQIQVLDREDSIVDIFAFTSTYIRDKNVYDKGLTGGTASFTLETGQKFRIATTRLSSQAARDDNPVDPRTSFLTVKRVLVVPSTSPKDIVLNAAVGREQELN